MRHTRTPGPSAQTAPGRAEAVRLVSKALSGPGQPLDEGTRAFMESAFGCDFGTVRIHTDARAAESADALAAQAYAVREHIVFAAGRYNPRSRRGLWLLGHELCHVCQQRGSGGSGILDWRGPEPACERAANRAADQLLAGRPLTLHRSFAPAPVGAIQCHCDSPCPGLPDWVPILDLSSRDCWLPANQAIEQAFAKDPQTKNHVCLFGSQFVGPGFEIRLPKGTPNKKVADELLRQFKGIANQLQPDIIDFTDRVFYEFKTPRFVSAGVRQLQSYYKLVEAIQRNLGAAGGPPWVQDHAAWFPPHTLPFPGDPEKRVCTQRTEYNQTERHGLIVYEVLQHLTGDEKKRRRARAAAKLTITDLAPELRHLKDLLERKMRQAVKEAEPDAEYRIVASADFVKAMIAAPNRPRVEGILRKMGGADLRQSLAIQVGSVQWAILGIGAAASVIVFVCVVVPELVVPAAAGSLTTGGAATGAAAAATVPEGLVPILAAMKAANDTTQVAAAAGVLLVIGTMEKDAAAAEPTVKRLSAVRAVPLADVQPQADFFTGRDVKVGATSFQEIGVARAGSGEACNPLPPLLPTLTGQK
jgi:hypothetical protein